MLKITFLFFKDDKNHTFCHLNILKIVFHVFSHVAEVHPNPQNETDDKYKIT